MPPHRRPSFVRLLFLVAAAAAATISSSFPLNRPSQRNRARPPPPPPPPSDFSPCRPPRAVVLPAVAVASRSSAAPRGTAGPSASNPFVTTAGTRFALGCAEFPVSGFNAYTLLEAASLLPCGSYGGNYILNGRAVVEATLSAASRRGATLLRTWAFSVAAGARLLLSPDGVYDAHLLEGLDFILHAASKHNLRVSLVLTDWYAKDGVSAFVGWAGVAKNAFYTDASCVAAYRRNALALINRVNSFSGIPYRDDPTIFGWELINEARCIGCAASLQAWVEAQSSFIAEHDRNHLITVGTESYWSTRLGANLFNSANPAQWALLLGQNNPTNHAPGNISYCALHAWPNTWTGLATAIDPVGFTAHWLSAHEDDAEFLKKPLLLSEFGFTSNDPAARAHFFASVFATVEASVAAGRPLRGDLFWVLYPELLSPAADSDPYALFEDDPLLLAAQAHAAKLAAAARAAGDLCAAAARGHARGVTV